MLEAYDYVDFGGSTAGSRAFVEKAFKAEKGLILSSEAKVIEAAKKSSIDVKEIDGADRAYLDGKVRFSILSNCLERQPDFATVMATVANALHISRSFVFIQLPYFDADGYLMSQGLKFHWSDWSAHPMPLTSLQLLRTLQPALDKQGVARVAIFGRNAIASSDDPRILPLSAGRNSGKYDLAQHGVRPTIAFGQPVYAQTVAIVARREARVVDSIVNKVSGLEIIYDSTGQIAQSANRLAIINKAGPAAIPKSAVVPPVRSRAVLGEHVPRSPLTRRF